MVADGVVDLMRLVTMQRGVEPRSGISGIKFLRATKLIRRKFVLARLTPRLAEITAEQSAVGFECGGGLEIATRGGMVAELGVGEREFRGAARGGQRGGKFGARLKIVSAGQPGTAGVRLGERGQLLKFYGGDEFVPRSAGLRPGTFR